MRVTTQLLEVHLLESLARLAESYIMDETPYPADMASAGHWELVSKFDADQLDSALYGACRGDSILLVKHVISLGATNYNFGLLGACCGNEDANREAGELMISLGAKVTEYDYFNVCARFANDMRMVAWLSKYREPSNGDFEAILRGGAFAGNMELVNFAIHNGANNWDMMLFDACSGGDTGMILLGLVNGGTPRLGLAGACIGGNIHAVDWMVRLGATNYDHGLNNAASENHIDVALHMLELMTHHDQVPDVDKLNSAFSVAYHNEYFPLARILLDRGASKCTHTHYCTDTWETHLLTLRSSKS
jgi:hypothetical protein